MWSVGRKDTKRDVRYYSPRIKSCCSQLSHSQRCAHCNCTVHASGDPRSPCLCMCLHGGTCHCSATHTLNLSGLDIMCVSHISAAKNRQALTWINSTACSLSPFTLSRKLIIFHYHSHEPHPPPSVLALRCVWT